MSDGSQIQPDTEYRGLICPPGDHDFFKVTLTAGTLLRAELYDLPADYQLSLYGPGGQWLDQSSNKGLLMEEIRHTAAVTGQYSVRVAPRGTHYDPARPYTLRISLGEPMVQVSPGLGVPGSTVHVRGQGFDPVIDQVPCDASIYWDHETLQTFLGRAFIATDGSFDLGVRVPTDALSGTHRLRTRIGCGPIDIPPVDVLLGADTDYPDDGCAQAWPPPWPDLDLSVLGIEVTQGVQCFDTLVGDTECADNSVPLLVGRPTVARVYIQVAGIPELALLSGVTARLYVRHEGDDAPGEVLFPTNGPINAVASDRASLDLRRNAIDGTLNFRLPPEWVAGQVILRPEVNPSRVCGPWESEEKRANNWGADVPVDFQEHAGLTIHYVRTWDAGTRADARVDDAWQWLYKLWPVGDPPEYEARDDLPPLVLDYDLDEHPELLITQLNEVYAVMALANLLGGPLPPRILFGWVPDEENPRKYGSSDPAWAAVQGASVAAWGRDTPAHFEKLLVHESGHDFDQHHTGVRPFWPYEGQTIQEVGFDTVDLQVKPADFWDAMRPGPASVTALSWLSPHTYTDIMAARPWGTWRAAGRSLALNGSTVPTEYAVIRGEIRSDQTGTLAPVYRVTSSSSPPIGVASPGGSDYCVQFLDATDHLLSARCFNASFVDEHDGQALDADPFFLIEPLPPLTTRFRLARGQTRLDERDVSANAPQVTVLAPNGGEQWGEIETISWRAADADGDALTYSVLVSLDDGQTWRVVAAALTEQTFRWDTSHVGGGQAARARVVVTDGANTVFDDSDGPFRINLKPPSAHIASPADGTTLRRPEAVLLLGRGFDLEDGELRGGALAWRSDRDGTLGTGNHIVTPELSRGRHVITLTATDHDGGTGAATVTIDVGPTPVPECAGDCGGDGVVTVDELLTMVNIALGNSPALHCLAGDRNADGEITVDEIVAALNRALSGCAAALNRR